MRAVHRVLIVETHAPTGEYLVRTIAEAGFEPIPARPAAAWETWAEMNPHTARDLGLSRGQIVRIESEKGSFQARLRFHAGAQPGMVNVPYGLHSGVEGWGRARGSNPLLAVGDARDPATGLPDWYSTRVRVVPA